MRAIKSVFWALLAVLLFAVLGLGVFISTFDANSYRGLLGDSVERATGRRLTINGELSLTLWPQIALRAEDLSLANPADFDAESAEQMLQAQALEATIALQPLLQRQLKIDGVVLHSPRLVLEQKSTGENNWSDLQQRFGNPAAEASGQLAVQLNRVTLKDATLSLLQHGNRMRVSALNAEANFTSDTELSLAADGAWQGAATATPVTFALSTRVASSDAQTLLSEVELTVNLMMTDATAPDVLTLTTPAIAIDANLDQATISQGTAQLANSSVSFEARLTNLLAAGQLDGSLTAIGADTAALLTLGAIDMPGGLPATRLWLLDLSATFTAALAGDTSGEVEVHNFSASLKGAKQAAWNLQANGKLRLNATGRATGNLTLAPVNLAELTNALPELFDAGLFRQAAADTLPQPTPVLQTLQTAFEWVPAIAATPATLRFSESRFAALGVTGTLAGEIRLTAPTSTTSAAIELSEFSPKQVLTYFTDPFITSDDSALSSASGRLSLLQDATGTHLRNLDIMLDKNRLRGDISVLPGPVPTLKFDTTLNTLDMTGYLAPETNATDAGNNTDLLGEMTLPTELLRAYDLKGSVRIGRLQLYDLLLYEAGGRIALGKGAAAINSLSARLYGGSFIGKIGFSQPNTDSGPELAVTGDIQGVDVQALMQALSNTHDFTGRGNVQINMTGRGYTALEATQSAAGTFGVQLQNGTYTGINIGHELCKLYNGLRNKPAPPAPADNSTRFDTFSASAVVLDGKAQTDDLIASNSYLKLSGKGATQLAKQSIRYDLDIELTGPIEATNCETLTPYIGSRIPVRLTGTFASPTLRPDFGKLAQREIRRRVEDKLTEKLFDLLGGRKTEPTADPAPETTPEP